MFSLFYKSQMAKKYTKIDFYIFKLTKLLTRLQQMSVSWALQKQRHSRFLQTAWRRCTSRFLVGHFSDDVSWTVNTTALPRPSSDFTSWNWGSRWQPPAVLSRARRHIASQCWMRVLRHSWQESASESDRHGPGDRGLHSASSRYHSRASSNNIKDSSQPGHDLFDLFPSGQTCMDAIRECFFPRAISTTNKPTKHRQRTKINYRRANMHVSSYNNRGAMAVFNIFLEIIQ